MATFLSIMGFILFIILISYPILIMPHMLHRPDFTPFDHYLYAHRGLHDNQGKAPENSLKAFRLAVEAGYGIELDIQLTKDRVPVVFHDYTLQRICKVEGKVKDFTLQELKRLTLCNSDQTIPTLQEALEVVKGKVPLIIEFKIERMDLSLCTEAMKVLEKYDGEYCVESFHPLALRWFKKNHKEIVRGQLSTDFIRDKEKGNPILYYMLSRMLFNFLSKPDFIAYSYRHPRMTSLVIVRDIYQLPCAAWTIKSQDDLNASKQYFKYMIFDSFIPEEDKNNP